MGAKESNAPIDSIRQLLDELLQMLGCPSMVEQWGSFKESKCLPVVANLAELRRFLRLQTGDEVKVEQLTNNLSIAEQKLWTTHVAGVTNSFFRVGGGPPRTPKNSPQKSPTKKSPKRPAPADGPRTRSSPGPATRRVQCSLDGLQ